MVAQTSGQAFERSNVQIPMFLYVRTIFSISQPQIILKVLTRGIVIPTLNNTIDIYINNIYVERVW